MSYRILALGVTVLTVDCGRAPHSHLGDPSAFPRRPPASSARGAAFRSEGVAQLTPLSDGFEASWDPVLDATGVASADYTYRIYVSLNGAAIDFFKPFLVTAPGAARATIDGLVSGTRVSVAVQADSLVNASDVDRNEILLDGVVAALWYVDGAAAPGGDGRTVVTALTTIAEAVQAVVNSGAIGNVLIAGGDYAEELILPGNVHLYGSYDAAFVARDHEQQPTTLRPAVAAATAIQIADLSPPTIVDGLDVDGLGLVSKALRVANAHLQWSNSNIFNLANEGISCASKTRSSLLRVRRVTISGCVTEGLIAAGSVNAELTSCAFLDNGKEGAEFDNLAVQPGGTSSLWVRDCDFLRNGNDGLDVDLNELFPSIGGTSLGGRIEVLIERSRAFDNANRGVIIDVDFQDVDEIAAAILLDNNEVSRQKADGVKVDADAASSFILVGNRSSANTGHGLSVGGSSSEAVVIVSNHWEIGSSGNGVNVSGLVPTVLAHAAVTGARGVSIVGNGSTLLVDGALWLSAEPVALDATSSYADPPIAGNGNLQGAPQTRVAPVQLFVLDLAGADRDRFSLPPGVTLFVGDWIELGNDGEPRQVTLVQASEVVFSPPAAAPPEAGALVARFASADVTEDPRLVPGSYWQDAGDSIENDSDGTVTDVGVLGGTLESFLPLDSVRWIPFVVSRMTPAPGAASGPFSQVGVGFTRPLDATTVDDSTIVVLLNGQVVSGTLSVVLDQIGFDADAPLSGGSVEVQLHGGIRSSTGEGLMLPFRYRIQIP